MQRRSRLTALASCLMLTAACMGESQPAPSPTDVVGTPTPTLPALTIPEPTAAQAGWKVYRDQTEGFEFQYPEACQIVPGPDLVAVGNRIQLVIDDAQGLGLADYVDQLLAERTKSNGWQVESRRTETIGGRQTIWIDYRFGGMLRFGSALFLEQAGKLFVWQFTAGGFSCDEATVYGDVFKSFRFTPGSGN